MTAWTGRQRLAVVPIPGSSSTVLVSRKFIHGFPSCDDLGTPFPCTAPRNSKNNKQTHEPVSSPRSHRFRSGIPSRCLGTLPTRLRTVPGWLRSSSSNWTVVGSTQIGLRTKDMPSRLSIFLKNPRRPAGIRGQPKMRLNRKLPSSRGGGAQGRDSLPQEAREHLTTHESHV